MLDFIIGLYDSWKVKNYDKPDTYFVRIVLVRYGLCELFKVYEKYKASILQKKKVKPNKDGKREPFKKNKIFALFGFMEIGIKLCDS
jgi:hypothetical protein